MQGHADKLQSLVDDALEKGAKIAVRGNFGNLGEDAVDQFFPPTVLTEVNHTMRIMQEEVTVCSLSTFTILNMVIIVFFGSGFWAHTAYYEVFL